MKSMKQYLLVVMLGLTIIPIIILNITNQFFLSHDLTRSVEQSNKMFTATLSKSVEDFLVQAFQLTQLLANSDDIKAFDSQKQEGILRSTVANNDYIDLLYVQGMDGMQTARSSGEVALRRDRWWFQQMLVDPKPFVSSTYYSVNGNVPVASVFHPVENNNGEMIGVMGADMKLSSIQDMVENFATNSEDIYIYIIDNEGKVVAHPNQNYVAEQYNYKTLTKTVLVHDNGGNIRLDEKGNHITEEKEIEVPVELQQITESALMGEHGVSEYVNELGDVVISGYHPIHIPGQSENWAVISVQDKTSAMAMIKDMLYKNVAVAVASILVVIIIVFMTSKRLINPIIEVIERVREVKEGDGDLTKRIDTKAYFEIARLIKYINGFIEHVHQMVQTTKDSIKQVSQTAKHVSEQTNQIAHESDNIGASLQESSSNAEEQIGQIEDGANSVSRVTEGIQKLSNLSESVKMASSETQDASKQAQISFQSISSQMQDIHKSVENSVQIVNRLGLRSQEIHQITEMITTVAEQTNLLALNAAIEAARVGEQGKGFAIVANEIRMLAERSAASANEITNVIDEILNDTMQAVSSMSTGEKVVEKGLSIVQETKQIFEDIGDKSEQSGLLTNDMNVEITNVLKESQLARKAIENIVQLSKETTSMIKTMSDSSQETIASTEEIAALSEMLTNLTMELNNTINHFKTNS